MKNTSPSNSSSKLQHPIPTFQKLSSNEDGDMGNFLESIIMKEIKLPFAKQTHEVCYEPMTKSIFVTQMTNSTLVKLTVDKNGILKDDAVESWSVGPSDGGLHNASPSYKYPGHIWLSLQYMNTLMLVNVQPGEDFLKVVEIYQVPTSIMVDGEMKHVGGPHCMRECPTTFDIWVCLKGALDQEHNPCAKLSQCCDPVLLKEAMQKHADSEDHDIVIPDSYAVWHLNRDNYNPQQPSTCCNDSAKGGKLYPCLNSPPMATLDKNANAWVAQDQSETLLFIDRESGESKQVKVPWPEECLQKQKHTGPGIATAPNGTIWVVQLETNGTMVRIDPTIKDETQAATLYQILHPSWARALRFIHLDFCKPQDPKHHNRIYAIASSLLQDESTDVCIVINMCDFWKEIKGIRIIPLSSQQSACHRITYCDIDDGDNEKDDGSVFITELAQSKLLQIKMNSDVVMTLLDEDIATTKEGFEHRTYTMTEEIQFGQSVETKFKL